MIKRFLVFFLCFLSTLTFAGVFEHPVTKNSKEAYLNALLKAYSFTSLKESVKGNFRQTKTLKKWNREFVSTGTFVITGESIEFITEHPFKTKLVITEDSFVQESLSKKHTEIKAGDNPIFAEISKMVRAIFKGDVKILEERFNAYYKKNNAFMCIGFMPKEKTMRKVIYSIELKILDRIQSITVCDFEGNVLVYELEYESQTK